MLNNSFDKLTIFLLDKYCYIIILDLIITLTLNNIISIREIIIDSLSK